MLGFTDIGVLAKEISILFPEDSNATSDIYSAITSLSLIILGSENLCPPEASQRNFCKSLRNIVEQILKLQNGDEEYKVDDASLDKVEDLAQQALNWRMNFNFQYDIKEGDSSKANESARRSDKWKKRTITKTALVDNLRGKPRRMPGKPRAKSANLPKKTARQSTDSITQGTIDHVSAESSVVDDCELSALPIVLIGANDGLMGTSTTDRDQNTTQSASKQDNVNRNADAFPQDVKHTDKTIKIQSSLDNGVNQLTQSVSMETNSIEENPSEDLEQTLDSLQLEKSIEDPQNMEEIKAFNDLISSFNLKPRRAAVAAKEKLESSKKRNLRGEIKLRESGTSDVSDLSEKLDELHDASLIPKSGTAQEGPLIDETGTSSAPKNIVEAPVESNKSTQSEITDSSMTIPEVLPPDLLDEQRFELVSPAEHLPSHDSEQFPLTNECIIGNTMEKTVAPSDQDLRTETVSPKDTGIVSEIPTDEKVSPSKSMSSSKDTEPNAKRIRKMTSKMMESLESEKLSDEEQLDENVSEQSSSQIFDIPLQSKSAPHNPAKNKTLITKQQDTQIATNVRSKGYGISNEFCVGDESVIEYRDHLSESAKDKRTCDSVVQSQTTQDNKPVLIKPALPRDSTVLILNPPNQPLPKSNITIAQLNNIWYAIKKSPLLKSSECSKMPLLPKLPPLGTLSMGPIPIIPTASPIELQPCVTATSTSIIPAHIPPTPLPSCTATTSSPVPKMGLEAVNLDTIPSTGGLEDEQSRTPVPVGCSEPAATPPVEGDTSGNSSQVSKDSPQSVRTMTTRSRMRQDGPMAD